MKRILIDTDVILDFFFDRKPFADHAAVLFSLCDQKMIRGFVTPVIVSNVYYLLRQTARHDKVIGKLTQLLSLTDVLTMDRSVVLNALKTGFSDFEDALQYSAALRNETIDVIVTRNTRDFRKSEIPVLTPSDFLNL